MENNLIKSMIKIKVIKTEKDYQEALKSVEELMNLDPNPDSTEGEQLNLLSALIEDYEERIFPKTLPNSIEAIKFRMEQSNLKQADLVPYIGSRSRVSEILSGKRQLTINMIRALSEGLGIPTKVLIKKPDTSDTEYKNWDNRLVAEMEKRKKTRRLKSLSRIDDFMSQVIDLTETEKEEVIRFLASVLCRELKLPFRTSKNVMVVLIPFISNIMIVISKEIRRKKD